MNPQITDLHLNAIIPLVSLGVSLPPLIPQIPTVKQPEPKDSSDRSNGQ